MGIASWRCAKTTKGIPVQRFQLTEVIAFLPNGDRVAGFLGNYENLLSISKVDEKNDPLPDDQNFPEHITGSIFELYAQAFNPPLTPLPDGDYRLADVDRILDNLKLVLAEEVEPTDTFENLPVSKHDPWAGYTYEYDEQWMLELDLALEFGKDLNLAEESDQDETTPSPSP
ncbi:hypothetical protein [Marinobacter sp. tcs-11]|uniref:hypothetical protein n=1 Tax=Marinobacter sp. tcs-11 TaxID=1742860 RepID=UPI00257A11D4|nr:hypothetical protein [Marinobacter sp. tcs-11]